MKSLIVLGLAVASTGTIANSDVTTIEGGVGRFEIIQQENFAPTTGYISSILSRSGLNMPNKIVFSCDTTVADRRLKSSSNPISPKYCRFSSLII